ncbi:hypothetical protein QVD17_10771 [Tagetes erecta]|uniref:Uncharacterized protein n=1 Tax=Tagetes erecta TaxID=13708 RepID=A0AAD8L6F3_TARER|nr:hypothetical protein QVD17_10771 [Tagetes erecta]
MLQPVQFRVSYNQNYTLLRIIRNMYRTSNYDSSYDNCQNGWDSVSPQYVHRDNVIPYSVPQSHNRFVFEEERPVANYYPAQVVFEEQYSVPVHKNHHHGPRKQVQFVEHEEKVTEVVDNFGNHKVYKQSIDTEADGFINRKHKNFEAARTFNSFNY